MKHALYGMLLALQFLTRLPIPVACPWTPATRRWAIRAYPLVGLMVGALLACVALLLGQWQTPSPIAALVLLSLWVAISGGLHLDGVMDLADALGSAQGGDLSGPAQAAIDAALALDPDQPKALALGGAAAARRGDQVTARRHWTRLLGLLEPGSEMAQRVTDDLARLAGGPSMTVVPPTRVAEPAGPARAASATPGRP